ncbi:MAG: hypothetical protein LUG14_06635 [Synergistaceae bacterium]|nr:hypothetical protein [Synergistaceae bacterium]
MILQNTPSTTEAAFSNYCVRNHLDMLRILSINDFDTQMQLCKDMEVMTLCPSMFICKILEHNATCASEKRLHAFPISGLENVLRVDMITPNNVALSAWMEKLIELLVEACALFSYL